MTKRKQWLRDKPSWVVAAVASGLVWGVVTVIAAVFFQATIMNAMLVGLLAGALIVAPIMMIEACAVVMAVALEGFFGVLMMVVLAPLVLLSGC